MWSQKVRDISVAWLQNSSVVLVLEVSVCILWWCVDHCECWTCAWLLSLIVIVLTLLCTTEPRGTMFTVRSNTSQPIANLSLTVYNYTSWRQNVADFFDIRLHIGSWVFFAVIGLVYTVVCVYSVFLKLPARKQTSTRWECVYCIVTYLPWYFRLALWLCRRSHRDLAADSNRYLLTWTLPLLCYVPFLTISFQVLHGVDMAFWTLAICILNLRKLLYSLLLACHLVDYVSWFFFSTWTIDISYLLDVNLD